jgi:hypothetical protein
MKVEHLVAIATFCFWCAVLQTILQQLRKWKLRKIREENEREIGNIMELYKQIEMLISELEQTKKQIAKEFHLEFQQDNVIAEIVKNKLNPLLFHVRHLELKNLDCDLQTSIRIKRELEQNKFGEKFSKVLNELSGLMLKHYCLIAFSEDMNELFREEESDEEEI